ncbi:S8 family serine peptidase [Deinococcus aquaticus]|uniref:S8 family serine peptidase n=1 Tax=Deinococcus aquaticus TaxID=328692 RepID=UPI0036229BAD
MLDAGSESDGWPGCRNRISRRGELAPASGADAAPFSSRRCDDGGGAGQWDRYPACPGGRRLPGHDFTSRGLSPSIPDWHGTAVAGVVHSVDPQAALLDVRVLGVHGQSSLGAAIRGLRWAVGLPVSGVPRNVRPARVITASFSLADVPRTGCDPAMQRAVDEVLRAGSVIVASAGNMDAPAARNTPAGCRGVLAVAATDQRGVRASYSNWGAAVALAAPGGSHKEGVDVLNVGTGERESMGTSFAAPLVAGAASLLLSAQPGLSPQEVCRILQRTARPFAGGRCDPDPRRGCGAGVLDITAALQAGTGVSHGP